jgi:hypothetical protein
MLDRIAILRDKIVSLTNESALRSASIKKTPGRKLVMDISPLHFFSVEAGHDQRVELHQHQEMFDDFSPQKLIRSDTKRNSWNHYFRR